MNKVFRVLLLFILFNMFLIGVRAVECDYGSFKIDLNEATGEASISKDTKGSYYYYIMDSLKEKFKNNKSCVQITKCVTGKSSSGSAVKSPVILYPERADAAADGAHLDNCTIVEVGGNEVELSKGDCELFDKYYNPILELVSDYDSCEDTGCKYSVKANLRGKVDYLKNYCFKIYESINYDEPCAVKCKGLEKDSSIESAQNILNGNNGTNECGLSDRLIGFIANLLKWVKFVIPVLVIIFGILDFIKAVGADKEDEMKKAQGKFAKRLIAAALIFIVPFILEFILNKMGFITEGCGILDF